MMDIYKYSGFYWSGDDDGTWVAVIGSTEYTRNDLEKMDPALNSMEQMDEIRRALSELPSDMTLPKRGQRRKIVAAEGHLDE